MKLFSQIESKPRVADTSAFEKLRMATISLVMPVCPSVLMEQFDSHYIDFHEILY